MKKRLVLILSVLCLLGVFLLFSCESEQNNNLLENEENSFSITYYVEGGTHKNPSTYICGKEIRLKAATKFGYDFIGWYSDVACTIEIETISKNTAFRFSI